ncbi:Armadillo repeat-containing protein 3 [Phytophthora ramorum]|nr:Vacuolar protein 8 [Phytophthora ramorum]
MEERGELPPSDKVAKYVGVVNKFLLHLERYRGQKLYKRLIKHQAMIREIGLIYEEIDMLFRMLNLAGTAAIMGWKQQWENDQRLQQDAMSRMVVNSGEVLKELQDTRAQLEAMMMLKYEMEQRSDQQSKETMHLMKSMMVTVVRASKATVENLPSWYFPPDEIEFEKDPFARGSFASVHRGLWGTGTKVVVKCFLVDDMVADERAKQKIESEMNLCFATQASDVRIKLSAPPASIFQSATSEEAGSDMADLLRAVESANGDEKERALLFVVQNCTNDKWRQLLYEANGVKLLSDLVRNGRTHFTQLYALECLHWASSSDAKVATSDVDALRDCVKEVTPQELVAVIDALKNSSDDGNEEGVIRCASIAAKGNNDDLGDSGAVDSDNETQKLWSGLVQPLAMLLQNGNDTQKLWTAEAMGNLALNNESIRSEIARKDAIRHLVALVQVGTSEQKHRAAYALGNLALSNDALGMIVRKGAIKALVTLMRGGTAQQKNGAAYALEIIMRCGYVNLSDIARETSVDPLVAILLVGNDEQKESAVTVLANLARNDKQCAEIASQGAISPLVTILQYGTEEQKQRAAVVLAGLAKREEHCEEIAREGAIKPLVVLLQSESDDQKLSAAIVLAGCSNSDANCDEIAREGAITPLLGLLRRGTEKQKESAAVVLASLAYGDSHRHAIARAGGIDPLVRLLSNGTDRQKYSGALALGNLASNDGSRGEIGRAGAIEPLIVLLQEGTDKQKSVAAFALGSLAWHNDHNRVEIADKGGIPHLVTLLDRGTEDQQYYAAGAIGNLASNAAVRLKVTHAECITLLVALVRDGSPRQKCAAALALGNLSSDIGANREKIARAGGVAPLVQLVESGTTDQKCYAALALANLATKNEANRAELARIGAKAPLLILAQSGTPDQKVYASKAAKKLSDAKVRKANLQVRVFNTFMRK